MQKLRVAEIGVFKIPTPGVTNATGQLAINALYVTKVITKPVYVQSQHLASLPVCRMAGFSLTQR